MPLSRAKQLGFGQELSALDLLPQLGLRSLIWILSGEQTAAQALARTGACSLWGWDVWRAQGRLRTEKTLEELGVPS